jgi:hypothetical protein
MADINIYGVDDIAVAVMEFRRSSGTPQFATLKFRDNQDTVTMFFTSLAEVEGLVERIQAALAERTVAPVMT